MLLPVDDEAPTLTGRERALLERLEGLHVYVAEARTSEWADPATVLEVVATSLADLSEAGGTR